MPRFTVRTTFQLVILIVSLGGTLNAQPRPTFKIPGAVLLFADPYYDLHMVGPNLDVLLKPPGSLPANHGQFSLPGLSPTGQLVAWGFVAVMNPEQNVTKRSRFSLGIYSLDEQRWQTYGEFDSIGSAAFSPDSSRVAFTVEQPDVWSIGLLEVSTGKVTLIRPSLETVTNGKGRLDSAILSWAPDGRHIAIRVLMSGNETPLMCVLDLRSNVLRVLARSAGAPVWSPDGEWIAYGDDHNHVVLIHPDGTGSRIVATIGKGFWWQKYLYSAVWSPDSKCLLLNIGRGEEGFAHEVFLLQLEAGRMSRKLKNGATVFGWALSPSSPK